MRERKRPRFNAEDPVPENLRSENLGYIRNGETVPFRSALNDCDIPAFERLAPNVKLAFYFTYLPSIEAQTLEEYIAKVDRCCLVTSYVLQLSCLFTSCRSAEDEAWYDAHLNASNQIVSKAFEFFGKDVGDRCFPLSKNLLVCYLHIQQLSEYPDIFLDALNIQDCVVACSNIKQDETIPEFLFRCTLESGNRELPFIISSLVGSAKANQVAQLDAVLPKRFLAFYNRAVVYWRIFLIVDLS